MYKIFSDGAYATSKNIGGWAFVVLKNDSKIYSNFNSVNDTTNNRMEIQAVIEACKYCLQNNIMEFTLISDSMYVIGTMSKGWKRNKNIDLWDILDKLVKNLNITWEHVKGHEGNKWNEFCDALAVTATNVYN